MIVRKLLWLVTLVAATAQAQVLPITKAVTVNPTNMSMMFPEVDAFGRTNSFLRFVYGDSTISVTRTGTTARLHVNFPSLDGYLTSEAAAATYQPIGDYVLSETLLDYLTIQGAAEAYVPLSRTITVNGDTQQLDADVSFTVQGGSGEGNPFDHIDIIETTTWATNSGFIFRSTADDTGLLDFAASYDGKTIAFIEGYGSFHVEDKVVVSYDELTAKNYSFSAGQYFDVKIEYTDMTPEQFAAKMKGFTKNLESLFSQSRELEADIKKQMAGLTYVA